MLFMDDLSSLSHIEIECAIGSFEDGADQQAVGMAGGFARHDHHAWPDDKLLCWSPVLPNKVEIALAILKWHRVWLLSVAMKRVVGRSWLM